MCSVLFVDTITTVKFSRSEQPTMAIRHYTLLNLKYRPTLGYQNKLPTQKLYIIINMEIHNMKLCWFTFKIDT